MFNFIHDEEVLSNENEDFENTEVNSRIASAYMNAALVAANPVASCNSFAAIRENVR